MTQDEKPIVEEVSDVPKAKGHRFAKNHPRFGGRSKKVTSKMWAAREVAEKLAFNPIEECIRLYRTGLLPTSPGKKAQEATASSRTKALEVVISFLLPRLSHQSVSGPDGGPIQTESLNLQAIWDNPALCDMAQRVSLAMTGYPDKAPRQLPAPDDSEKEPQVIDAETES